MQRSKMWVVLGIAVTLSSALWAKSGGGGVRPLANSDEAKALSEKVIGTIEESGAQAGLSLVKSHSYIINDVVIGQWVSTVTSQRKTFESQSGRPKGYVLVKEQSVADTFLRLVYVERAEKAAIRWVFTYYNPSGSGWVLHGLYWDYNIEPLFSSLNLSGADLA